MNTLTENNHEEMKTTIETFLIEETIELIHDGDKLDEWKQKVQELGLKGQNTIVSKDKSPIPFMHLKRSLENILSELCPLKVGVEDYSVTPIPLEILKLIGLSRKENYFNEIQIWYDDVKPDPVCMGLTGYWAEATWYTDSNQDLKGKEFNSRQEVLDNHGKHATFYERSKYLIGKWADVKHSFKELSKMAKERFLNKKTIDLKKTIKNAQRELDDLDVEASETFNV